jgi:peptidoglycan/LPS O-acetylase OafA/YrhL
VSNSRVAALDLSRFVAAIIVFTGHLFFLPSTYLWSDKQISILSPIQTGDTAVLYFFALSGYVLTIKNDSQRYVDWVTKRCLRLYPVYFSAWFLGLVIILSHDQALLSIKVLVLGLIGFQSLDPSINLVINAPLWSLSVEIIFAFFIYFMIKLRRVPVTLFALAVCSLLLWNQIPNNPVIRAFPYFAVGILLNSPVFYKIRLKASLINFTLLVAVLYYFVSGAKQLLALEYDLTGETIKLVIISLLIFSISKAQIPPSFAGACVALGKRSFCIYAFHYPVLLVLNYLIHPKSHLEFSTYILASIGLTVCISEVTYRLIDRPSMRLALRQ